MSIVLDLNLLINLGMLVVAVAMFLLTLWKIRLLEQNHLVSMEKGFEERFEEFKEAFWQEFGKFRDTCNAHRMEEAKRDGQIDERLKALEGAVQTNVRKIERLSGK